MDEWQPLEHILKISPHLGQNKSLLNVAAQQPGSNFRSIVWNLIPVSQNCWMSLCCCFSSNKLLFKQMLLRMVLKQM